MHREFSVVPAFLSETNDSPPWRGGSVCSLDRDGVGLDINVNF